VLAPVAAKEAVHTTSWRQCCCWSPPALPTMLMIVEPMISMMVMLPDSMFMVPTMMIVESLALGGA
jgi:hypothetical protein